MCSGPSVRIKLICRDGAGLCLFAKRLEDGIFRAGQSSMDLIPQRTKLV